MSLLVDGHHALSLTFSNLPRTVLSSSFALTLSRHLPGSFLVTLSAGGYGPISFPLECDVTPSLAYDIALGVDWASTLRDYLLDAGFRLPTAFDAWVFFSSRS